MAILTIITVGDEMLEATANLFAPIVIHMTSRTGKQVVLHDSGYSTKQRIFAEKANLTGNEERG